VFRLLEDADELFLRDGRAILSSLRRTGEDYKVENAVIRADYSCLIMTIRQQHYEISSFMTSQPRQVGITILSIKISSQAKPKC